MHVGAIKVVSLSQTALNRSQASEHIMQRLVTPPSWMNKIARTMPEDAVFCRTICGKTLMATTEITHQANRKALPAQTRHPCALCARTNKGGAFTVTLLPPIQAALTLTLATA